MRGKHYQNQTIKKNRKSSGIIVHFLLLIFVSIMIISGMKIYYWIRDNMKSKDLMNNIQKEISIDENIDTIEKYSVNFKNLKQNNSDTIAWIKVFGTNIEYPVVQTTNNDYYMTHSFDRTDNSAGWVFMDYKNKPDGTDNNTVIYAHNRRDGSLFGTLKNILTTEWQNDSANFIIPFITENEKSEYQIFSVYKIEKEDYYITTHFASDNEYKQFIDKIKSRSEMDFKVDVTTQNKILTLSTCADNNKYRIVLHAKKNN